MNYLLLFQTWTNEQMDIEQQNADMGWSADLVWPTVIAIGIVALIAVLLSVFNMFKNPGALKNFLFGAVALIILAAVGFAISGSNVPEVLSNMVSPNTYKLVGVGMFMAGALIGIGLLILLLDLVRGIFKI